MLRVAVEKSQCGGSRTEGNSCALLLLYTPLGRHPMYLPIIFASIIFVDYLIQHNKYRFPFSANEPLHTVSINLGGNFGHFTRGRGVELLLHDADTHRTISYILFDVILIVSLEGARRTNL